MSQWKAHAHFVSAAVSEGFTAVAVGSLEQLVKTLEASTPQTLNSMLQHVEQLFNSICFACFPFPSFVAVLFACFYFDLSAWCVLYFLFVFYF